MVEPKDEVVILKTLYMLKGLPGSGKSTRAKEMLAEFGTGNAKRVNKDSLRDMLDCGAWSRDNEKFLLTLRDQIVIATLAAGKHALVDDTNLAPKHEARLRQLAQQENAAFEIVDFTHVDVETCIQRDLRRLNSVGETVIRDMWRQFLYKPAAPPPYNPALPVAIIVDIDGTVAKITNRGPFEWDKVDQDEVREVVASVVYEYVDQWGGFASVIFVSGRDECCRTKTEKWLKDKLVTGRRPNLFMRPAGDQRKDSIVKRELYEAHIKGKYNVVAIFDDRLSVCRMWRDLGFGDRLFRVGPVDADDF